MKRSALLFTALQLALLAPLSCRLLAAETPRDEKPSTISVTGSAMEEFTPDTAILSLAVETQAVTVAEASQANNIRSEQVIAALKKGLDLAGGDSLKTAAFSVQPIYEYDEKKRKNIMTGYRVTNRVTVTTSRIKTVGELIDRGLKNGANSVDNVRFVLKDDSAACKSLLTKAVERAKTSAETVAHSLGLTLDGVRQVTPSCGSDHQPPIIYGMAKARMADAAEAAPPIEAGTTKVNSSVSIEFYLKK
jgi:hypothetical protein